MMIQHMEFSVVVFRFRPIKYGPIEVAMPLYFDANHPGKMRQLFSPFLCIYFYYIQ